VTLSRKNRGRALLWTAWFSIVALTSQIAAQTAPTERVFPQSKTEIEKVVATLQASLAGHLPILDGFARAVDHPLDRYDRGYYQSTVQVTATPSGESLVRVTTKVTAWYADPVASHSGYQLLTSNGRIEGDFLDRLSEQLSRNSNESAAQPQTVAAAKPDTATAVGGEPTDPMPTRKFPAPDRTFSSSLKQNLSTETTNEHPRSEKNVDKATIALQAEANSLEETLRNQGHPKNLVAVKKSGTPVVATPSLTAKPQFLASLHDEFEMLDFNADWVHIRISGLSRGWIWRNSVEMPEGFRDNGTATVAALAPAADLFHVIREEVSTFPGDWTLLRNRNVKIISVQKVDENTKDAGSNARLEYAKFLLEKGYKELAQKPQDLAGIVIIFDSADGGMIAATMPVLQQWKAGALSDAALWHKCFFDPPETFDSAGSSASQ
jgi:hypothetical protein